LYLRKREEKKKIKSRDVLFHSPTHSMPKVPIVEKVKKLRKWCNNEKSSGYLTIYTCHQSGS